MLIPENKNTESQKKFQTSILKNKHKNLTKEEHLGIFRDWLWYTILWNVH